MIAALALAALLAADADPGPLTFERSRIGEGIYEAASAFDVNNDGVTDIVSGEYWYPGPDFTTAHKICDIRRVEDYYDDFSNIPLDVNGDGYLDIVSGGWWNQSLVWRENPKGQPEPWTTHVIAEIGNVERASFYDIDGDGHFEIVPNTPGAAQRIFRLNRDANGKGTGTFSETIVRDEPSGHGLGAGDINGDGRMDLVLTGGWLEAPADPFEGEWTWHGGFDFGGASVPILVHDVNGDGLNDLIVGQGHDYGLHWYEQRMEDGTRTWTQHVIEADRSQFHEMQLADVDNDGTLELVTGKRWRAHLGNDPGANDPLGVYYYDLEDAQFVRRTLDYGPAGEASGVGIYMWIADVDGNGWQDIVAPGKEGLFLFKNRGRS